MRQGRAAGGAGKAGERPAEGEYRPPLSLEFLTPNSRTGTRAAFYRLGVMH
jgi:hypothetical protein